MGFTRKELAVLAFLVVSFLAGVGVWIYRARFAPLPEVESPFDIEDSVNAELRRDSSRVDGSVPAPQGEEGGAADKPWSLEDLNGFTQEQIEALPGLGPVLAERVIHYREEHGPLRTLDELLNVKGIGPKTLERIKSYFDYKP